MSALLFANNLPKLENNKVMFSALGQKPHSNVILGIRFKLWEKKKMLTNINPRCPKMYYKHKLSAYEYMIIFFFFKKKKITL